MRAITTCSELDGFTRSYEVGMSQVIAQYAVVYRKSESDEWRLYANEKSFYLASQTLKHARELNLDTEFKVVERAVFFKFLEDQELGSEEDRVE